MNIIIILGALIIYTMIGYPVVLEILNRVIDHKRIDYSMDFRPKVSIIIPAHNEEKVIEKKLLNLLETDYDLNEIEIIVASDNSLDNTDSIVTKYVTKYSDIIKLYQVKQRKGKTNAQDEAVKIANGEVLIFTDANSMFAKNAISEMVSTLNDEQIGYVAGKLVYTNSENSVTSESENSYWSIDLNMRKVESDISSITAGNGSIYAVRKNQYEQINPMYSHDSIFPPLFVLKGLRSVFNSNAIAYEKAGETDEDEFKRKIRMSRCIISINFVNIEKYNFFKYGWFSFFYVSHRTLRNNLYLMHLSLYLINFMLLFWNPTFFVVSIFIFQNLIYFIGIRGKNTKNRYFKYVYYYFLTILAQLIGAKNELTGKSKPFWEKAESTR